MARNGGGIYSLPAVYEATPGTTILSNQHNTPLEDLESDANTARPIIAGGTGETTAAAAATAFGVGDLSTPSFGASQTLKSTDAGASAGPELILDRNSASPAAADVLGQVTFRGRDNGAANQDYARINAVITDTTAASEDGFLSLNAVLAGAMTEGLRVYGDGPVLYSADAGATVNPVLKLYRDSATPAADDVLGAIYFQGEDGAGNTENYAQIIASILDPTSTDEDGQLDFKIVKAGTLTSVFTLKVVNLANTEIAVAEANAILKYTRGSNLNISAGGSIAITNSFHGVDVVNGSDSTDNLDNINVQGGTPDDGMIVVIKPVASGRSIVVRHNQGNIFLRGTSNITLSNSATALQLIYNSSQSFWTDI